MSVTPARVHALSEAKRILITNVNGLLGHELFEQMRNDHILIHQEGAEPHRFLGTLNPGCTGGMVTPSPSDTIKLLEAKSKPKTFAKQVRNADYVILDISQLGCDLEEADAVLKALKCEDAQAEKDQVLVVISSPMVWSSSKPKEDGQPFSDEDQSRRIPLPKF